MNIFKFLISKISRKPVKCKHSNSITRQWLATDGVLMVSWECFDCGLGDTYTD